MKRLAFGLTYALCACGPLLPNVDDDIIASSPSVRAAVLDAAVDRSDGDSGVDGGVDGGVDSAASSCSLTFRHDDGLADSFDDCVAVGFYTSVLAMDACHAWISRTGDPSGGSCSVTCNGSAVQGSDSDAKMATWAFSGPAEGHVTTIVGICPSPADLPWR